MTRSIGRWVAVLAAGVMLLTMFGGVAQAACSTTNFCAWTGTNEAGTKRAWNVADSAWPDAIKNDDQTHRNHGTSSGNVLRTYTGNSYAGTVISCLPNDSGSPYYNVDVDPTPANDGQSHRWESQNCSNPGG